MFKKNHTTFKSIPIMFIFLDLTLFIYNNKSRMDNFLIKNCEICNCEIKLKIVTKIGSKNYGKPRHNKRFCSINCQIVWQKNVKWEDRVGTEVAEKIRLETSKRVKGDKNPSTNKEVAEKISKSLKKYLSENPRLKEKNGMFNKKHTDEYKKKSSESKKGKWSYDINGYKKLLERTPRGENHPNWLGGVSKLPYPFGFDKKLKKIIKERDEKKCMICDKQTQKLCIHHIDYNKDNINEENLISLCVNCHSKTNYNRDHWKMFFESKIKEIYKK
ncbi:MAG: HNH endonuclease [Nanoarchaeota archaeon]